MNEALWTKADGTVIPIRLMSDRHLENTILMLRRRGYVSRDEVGPMPAADAPESACVAWAAQVTSPLLDQLAWERWIRVSQKRAPLDDDEAERQQARWAASIRVGAARPHRAPYPPRHSLSPYRRTSISDPHWSASDPQDPERWMDDEPSSDPYGS